MLKKKLKALIYARTHQDAVDYADEPGVEEQISRAMDIVKDSDMLLADVYADEGFDGLALQRPGFLEMLDAIIAGEADVIVVDDICRISDNMLELAYLMTDILPEMDAGLAFKELSVQTDAPGQEMDNLMDVIKSYVEGKDDSEMPTPVISIGYVG